MVRGGGGSFAQEITKRTPRRIVARIGDLLMPEDYQSRKRPAREEPINPRAPLPLESSWAFEPGTGNRAQEQDAGGSGQTPSGLGFPLA